MAVLGPGDGPCPSLGQPHVPSTSFFSPNRWSPVLPCHISASVDLREQWVPALGGSHLPWQQQRLSCRYSETAPLGRALRESSGTPADELFVSSLASLWAARFSCFSLSVLLVSPIGSAIKNKTKSASTWLAVDRAVEERGGIKKTWECCCGGRMSSE